MSKIERVQLDISGKGYKSQQDRFYLGGGDMCALPANRTENKITIIVPEATKQGYAEAQEGDSINLSVPNSKTRRGRVGKGMANTLDTQTQQFTLTGKRVRRLTEVECERLQGFPSGWTEGTPSTQRYKCLGNAVTVNVVEEIAKRLKT